jgi:hypothetical protein
VLAHEQIQRIERPLSGSASVQGVVEIPLEEPLDAEENPDRLLSSTGRRDFVGPVYECFGMVKIAWKLPLAVQSRVWLEMSSYARYWIDEARVCCGLEMMYHLNE